MIAKLVVASGKSAGRPIAIKRGRLLIGRAEECDVRPLSEEVSRRHCAVVVGPADVWVEDLGSRNGTFVNGDKITAKTRVRDNDVIRVGSLELRVSCSDPAARAGSDNDVSKWLLTDESAADSAIAVASGDTTQVLPAAVMNEPAVGGHAQPPGPREATPPPAVAPSSPSRPGLLPREAKKKPDSSRDAAAEALKKFFDNR
jgi:predicted component of type VI protein secretion system